MMKISLNQVFIHSVTMSEALDKLNKFLDSNKTNLVFTPNSEILMDAKKNPNLKNILNRGDLVVADGAGVVIASKIIGKPLPERVAGFDLTTNFLSLPRDKKLKVFLLGSKPETVEKASHNMFDKFPNIEIVGYNDGYFSKNDENNIIQRINESKANVLLVALGAPKQEYWIYNSKDKLNVNICIGVGGSLDIFAGTSKRAPRFFQDNNLEWLYRLSKEPWRFVRMLALPKFIVITIIAKVFNKT